MPERLCDLCGRPYTAQRATSKYCSTRCRVRASKTPAAVTAVTPVGSGGNAPERPSGGLLGAVRAELEAIGQLDTAHGHLAVALAERLTTTHESASGTAQLSRELREVLASAAAAKAAAVDEWEEIFSTPRFTEG
jgi:hypothetical protein